MTVSIVFESLFCRDYCQAHSPTTTDVANLLPALPFCQRLMDGASEGRRQKCTVDCPVCGCDPRLANSNCRRLDSLRYITAFCLLPSAFCLLPSDLFRAAPLHDLAYSVQYY